MKSEKGRPGSVRRRGATWRERLSLAVFVCLVAAFVTISFAGSFAGARGVTSSASTASSSISSSPETFVQGEPDFSKFSHASQRHASLACASCHRRAADNSAEPRLPGHKACTDCHLAQFVTPNMPMCAICHASVEGENPPVKAFPGIRSFNARFDHAQHNTGDARPREGCVACHQPASRRSSAVTIPAGLAAHRECYTCHTPQAQAAGRDIATCGVCHAPTQRFFRTQTNAPSFRVGFSHVAHGARQRLGCTDCHQMRAGLAQSVQVTSTRPVQHFPTGGAQSCASCHNDRRSFGEAHFNDCRRCHAGQTFRAGG
ncbi:MAG: cytochrome c3 family protein [Pyrinomonadaceae bacterium]